MRALKSADCYFVAASCLGCLCLLLWVVVPRVQANRATRQHLEAVIEDTKALVEEVRSINRRTEALAGDPFVREFWRRRYFERQHLPWPEGAEMPGEEWHAGHTEPGRR